MDVRRLILTALMSSFAVAVCWPSHAFERDTHYYGTYALALTTCFEPAVDLCSVFDATAPTHRLGYNVQSGLYTHTEFAELDESIRQRLSTSCGSGSAARSSADLP